MASLIDCHNAASSDPKRLYHAVRKCDSLKAPAIFFGWEDCNFYVDNDENEGVVDWESFEQLFDAVKYLTLKEVPTRQGNMHPSDYDRVSAAGKAAARDVEGQRKPHLKNESFIATSAATVTNNETPGAAFMKTLVIPTKLFNIPASSKTILAKDRERKREETWNEKFQLLKAFQAEYGTCDCCVIGKDSSEKYKGLHTWALYWRKQIKKSLMRLPYAPKGNLAAQAKLKLLLDIGIGQEDASSQTPPSSKSPGSSTKRSAEQALLPLPSPKKLKTPVVADLPEEAVEGKVEPADPDYESYDVSETEKEDDVSETEKEDFDDSDTESSKAPHSSRASAPSRGESIALSAGLSRASDEKLPPIKRSPRFEHNLALVKYYTEEFGTNRVDPIKCIGRFKGLHIFLSEWRRKSKLFQKDPSNISESTNTKLQHVMALVDLEAPIKCSKYKTGSSRRVRWEKSFNLLKEYNEIHGTCMVKKSENTPPKFRCLHGWWYHQRDLVRKYDEDPLSSTLDEDQYKRLMDLDCVTEGKRTKGMLAKCTDVKWEEMFGELQAFVKDQGHTVVPSMPRTRLRNWIELMRGHYSKMEAGHPSKELTPARIAQMLGIGFSFHTRARLSFDERALQWFEYKTKNGRDPPTDSGTLGQWTLKMRMQYAQFKAGNKTPLTQERVDKLTAWEFRWKTGFKKPTKVAVRKSWEERYQELREYKAANGHCVVPQLYEELGHWVHRQRKEYTLLQDGKKSFMTIGKITKLNEIGFVFLTRKRPQLKRFDSLEAQKKSYDFEPSEGENDLDEKREMPNQLPAKGVRTTML